MIIHRPIFIKDRSFCIIKTYSIMFVSFSYLIIFRSMEDEGGETKQFVGGKLLLLIFHYFCVLITFLFVFLIITLVSPVLCHDDDDTCAWWLTVTEADHITWHDMAAPSLLGSLSYNDQHENNIFVSLRENLSSNYPLVWDYWCQRGVGRYNVTLAC